MDNVGEELAAWIGWTMDTHFVIVVPLSLLSTCVLYLTQSFTLRVHLLILLLRLPSKNMFIIITRQN